MKVIDLILAYMRYNASPEERKQVKEIIDQYNHPPVDVELFVENVRKIAKDKYTKEGNKLSVVKYVKDVTSWSLKECKDFCDQHVFPIIDFTNKMYNNGNNEHLHRY